MTEDDLEIEHCGCDFVENVLLDGRRAQVHHVIPDDGAPHETERDCPCGPDLERVTVNLLVVDHRDQGV